LTARPKRAASGDTAQGAISPEARPSPSVGRFALPWRICAVADLDATGAKEFEYGDPRRFWGFVVRAGRDVRGYVNACPHAGLPLNLSGDHFFDAEGGRLLCRMHGALFRPGDGFCLSGPCRGAHLKPLAVAVRGGAVWLCA
jgi:nitrite reductase/ring-hydroxylating ferredoxin subunit